MANSSCTKTLDADGDIRIADPMRIGVVVAQGVPFSEKLRAKKWWVLAASWGCCSARDVCIHIKPVCDQIRNSLRPITLD